MLCLTRKQDESILIGDDIEIVVIRTRGDQVRIGIKAPQEIPVHRREVRDAIKREEAKAESATKAPVVPDSSGSEGFPESKEDHDLRTSRDS